MPVGIADIDEHGNITALHGAAKAHEAEIREQLAHEAEQREERRAAEAAKEAATVASKEAVKASRPPSMLSVSREMVLAGKTDAEVLQALVDQFALPPERKHYAAFYRYKCVQMGLVTKEWAAAHSGKNDRQGGLTLPEQSGRIPFVQQTSNPQDQENKNMSETATTTPAAVPEVTVKAPRASQNGIGRPAAGTKTGQVFDVADEVSKTLGKPAPRKDVMEKCKALGINEATIATQYGRWRKFNGLKAEAKPAAEAKPEEKKSDVTVEAAPQ